jgi:hypothetical protein
MLANMPPPWYQVTIPPGRNALYEVAPPLFIAMAAAAIGLWYAGRKSLGRTTRRTLIWLGAGFLVVAYSTDWVWQHRFDGQLEPDLTARVAVHMPCFWTLCCAAIIILGWRWVRAGNASSKELPRQVEPRVASNTRLAEPEVAVEKNPSSG